MRPTRCALVGTVVALGLTLTLAGADALACGGCFHGPPPPTIPGQPPAAAQVVTDHRMVLSLSAQQTTLWDQIRYAGRPQEFSWILPIRYTAQTRIGISTDAFLDGMNNLTVPTLTPPPPPWPFCPNLSCPDEFPTDIGTADDAASWSDTGSEPPVMVLHEAVVGPYAVVVIRGTDPMAMRNWLRDNGFNLPAALSPMIDFYTQLNMDYIALRLRPGEGVTSMAPVHVTTPGYNPRLPLRMIAAGVADRVGLSLVTLAQGRIEAQNFPNGELSDQSFTWDWRDTNRTPSGDFVAAFNLLNTASAGRLWLTETARIDSAQDIQSQFMNFPMPAETPDGGMMVASVQADLALAFTGLTRPYLTRLRADLPARMLDRDLELAASNRGMRSSQYSYGRQVNIPPPPTCSDGSRYDPALRRFVGGRPLQCPERGGVDAGTTVPFGDAGSPSEDLGNEDAEAAGDVAPMPSTANCGCRVHGAPVRAGSVAFVLALAGVLASRRRARG